MNDTQRQAAIDFVKANVNPDYCDTDADATDPTHFDPVVDGVWVRGWFKVPASAIPDYKLDILPPSIVTVENKPDYEQAFADGLADVIVEKTKNTKAT